MSFFDSLVKPSWIPPNWAFPAAWFTLWAVQAVAAVRLGQSNDSRARVALGLLGTQFVVSVLWQAVVFGPGRLLLAALWLSGLWILEIATTIVCMRSNRLAGLLVAPTIVWVSVATLLGWSLYRLNPSV
jgi:translocator protein